jgi:hypothetical protein
LGLAFVGALFGCNDAQTKSSLTAPAADDDGGAAGAPAPCECRPRDGGSAAGHDGGLGGRDGGTAGRDAGADAAGGGLAGHDGGTDATGDGPPDGAVDSSDAVGSQDGPVDAAQDSVDGRPADGGAPDGMSLPCSPGETQCEKGCLETCMSDGTWGPPITCAGHQTCTGPVGAGRCVCKVDELCSAAGNVCESATSLVVCRADQFSCLYRVSSMTCPEGTVCEGAAGCVSPP